MNYAIIIGNLVEKPIVRQAKHSYAINLRVATSDGPQGQTEYHTVVMYKKEPGIFNSLDKGARVCCEGKIQNRSWENKEGNKVYVTEINAHKVDVLD